MQYRSLVAPAFAGRKLLVAFDVLVPAAAMAKDLAELGADVFVLGATRGTGPLPEPAPGPMHCLDVEDAPTMMEAIRAAEGALRALPTEVVEAIDRWDPAGDALVVSTIFSPGTPIAGRRVMGARPASWQALEDKTVVDALWEELDVPRAPFRTCPVADVSSAVEAVRTDLGAVISGDSRDGFNGGATYVRWVDTSDEVEAARAFFAPRCDKVRVMPFLDGIPCSIHGIVFPETTVVTRPTEMLILRRGRSFEYLGMATYWNPEAEDTAAMQALARTVGEHLRQSVDYRGAFSIDGVLTAAGFRPTEINPRVGAALPLWFSALDVSVVLLNVALVEGLDADWRAADLQQQVFESARTLRGGKGRLNLTRELEPSEHYIRTDPGAPHGFTTCDESDSIGKIVVGPAAFGSLVFLRIDPDTVPIGPSYAPTVAALAAFASDLLKLGEAPYIPAVMRAPAE